jgi:hypothetical protein
VLHGDEKALIRRHAIWRAWRLSHFSIDVHKQAHPYGVFPCADIPRR